jgi:2-C-methyl-D-erythritol 4-phosphate cytidylyltransferase
MVYAIIVAGGSGLRFSKRIKKQFFKVNNKSILELTIEKFNNIKDIDNIILVLPKDEVSEYSYLKNIFKKITNITSGGDTRTRSVYNGLLIIKPHFSLQHDKVLIHDGVRPLVSEELIKNIIYGLDNFNAVVPGIKIEDNVKKVDAQNIVTATIDRSKLKQK